MAKPSQRSLFAFYCDPCASYCIVCIPTDKAVHTNKKQLEVGFNCLQRNLTILWHRLWKNNWSSQKR